MELNDITPLCQLAYKYGTDKCPQIKHAYTPFYYRLLKKSRFSVKKVLELGIGANRKNTHRPKVVFENGIVPYLKRGASLYMWRDFFPNAQIFGVDIDPNTLFNDNRIITLLCNERQEKDLDDLINKIGRDIDLVVDDASHHTNDQIFAAVTLIPRLGDNVVYIIEDVTHSRLIIKALDRIGKFNFQIPDIKRDWRGGMILVVTKQPAHG